MNRRLLSQKTGARVAQYRKALGMTQTELGERVGISQSVLASYETGRRCFPVALIPALAQQLRVSTDELMGLAVGERKKPGPASRLERQLDLVRRLPRKQQDAVATVLDMALKNALQASG